MLGSSDLNEPKHLLQQPAGSALETPDSPGPTGGSSGLFVDTPPPSPQGESGANSPSPSVPTGDHAGPFMDAPPPSPRSDSDNSVTSDDGNRRGGESSATSPSAGHRALLGSPTSNSDPDLTEENAEASAPVWRCHTTRPHRHHFWCKHPTLAHLRCRLTWRSATTTTLPPRGIDAPTVANGLAHGSRLEAVVSVDGLGNTTADPPQGYLAAHATNGEAQTAQRELTFAEAYATADEPSNAHITSIEALRAQHELYPRPNLHEIWEAILVARIRILRAALSVTLRMSGGGILSRRIFLKVKWLHHRTTVFLFGQEFIFMSRV